jgi:hypothetical protein
MSSLWQINMHKIFNFCPEQPGRNLMCQSQRFYQRWLDKRIYKTEMKFWAVLGSPGCRKKKV